MSKIEIKWIYDEHDCDTCGSSYAEGAIVKIDGKEALVLEPFAHCFDDQSFSETEVFEKILEHLGHEVVFYD